MKRGDIVWASLPAPVGRRPVLILTRTAAISVRSRVTVANITTTVRGIRSEVTLGRAEGMKRACVANCDEIATIPRAWLDPAPAGSLSSRRIDELNRALRYALGLGA